MYIISDIDMNRKYICIAREELKDRGLIDFTNGDRGKPAEYILITPNVNNSKNKCLDETTCESECCDNNVSYSNTKETQLEHKSNTKETQLEHKSNTLKDIEDNKNKENISNEMQKKVEVTFDGTRIKPLTYTLSFNPKDKSDVDAYERFEDFRAMLVEWLSYKKRKGKTYKDDVSVKKMYKKLLNDCEWNAEYGRKILDDAQANGYDGFFPIKDQQKKAIEQECLPDDGINWDNVVNAFNRLGVCRVETLDDTRKQKFLRILKEFGKDKLLFAYKNIKDSSFLKGDTKEKFVADFDFVFDREKFIHILEKKYR